MKAIRMKFTEFLAKYERLRVSAKREPIILTHQDQDDLVVMGAEEYERLRRLDDHESMAVEDLSQEELKKLEESEISEESRKLDHLVPRGW